MQDERRAGGLRERAGDGHRGLRRPRSNEPTTRSIFEGDARLLAQFRAGDQRALALVYRRYADSVASHLSVLARAIGALEFAQPSAVADLSQEVFARAFSASARSAYDERRPYGPYLNAIAKNCLVDLLRKRRRDIACERDDATIDRSPFARDDEVERTLLAVVESYVSALPDPLRAVYEQRFELGLTQKAACDALGITRRSLRTAETQLKRGVCEALFVAGVLARSEGGGTATA